MWAKCVMQAGSLKVQRANLGIEPPHRTLASDSSKVVKYLTHHPKDEGSVPAGNTKGGSITVPLTSCLTGLESAL
jgi:hypothetical protein